MPKGGGQRPTTVFHEDRKGTKKHEVFLAKEYFVIFGFFVTS
jgi:hypothetical protein